MLELQQYMAAGVALGTFVHMQPKTILDEMNKIIEHSRTCPECSKLPQEMIEQAASFTLEEVKILQDEIWPVIEFLSDIIDRVTILSKHPRFHAPEN